jgi:hypothetical protein
VQVRVPYHTAPYKKIGLFTSRSRSFLWYGDVTIACEGLQVLDLCSALRAFDQERIFIVLHLLWHGASVSPVSFEGPSHLMASNGSQRYYLIASPLWAGRDLYCAIPAVTQGLGFFRLIWRTVQFNRLLRHVARGCRGPILTQIPTSPYSVRSKCKATIHLFTERTHKDPS